MERGGIEPVLRLTDFTDLSISERGGSKGFTGLEIVHLSSSKAPLDRRLLWIHK